MSSGGATVPPASIRGRLREGEVIDMINLHESTPSGAPVSAPGRRRLLLAEDDEIVRTIVIKVADSLGFEIVATHDGDAAIKALRRGPFDTLVTDIHMPDMDGLELIRAARKIGSPLHIVAISGGDSYGTSFLRAARQLGADVTLPKPFDIADLVAALGGVTPSPTSGRPDATNAHHTL